MNEQTKITIITACYNSELTIENTIKSVLAQEYKALEYIIVDGDSKDNTVAIVNKYAVDNLYIKVISEPDEGISDAFNKGIRLASGTLIGLINSDDELAAGALESVNNCYINTNADVIYGDTIVMDKENGLKILKKAGEIEKIKYEMPFIHQSCFVKRTAYEEVGVYNKEYKLCMDYDMMARLYHSKYYFAKAEGVISIFHYGGTSCEHPIRTINEDMKIAEKYGLGKSEVIKYKLKLFSKNICKRNFVRLGIWRIVYKLLKGGALNNEEGICFDDHI